MCGLSDKDMKKAAASICETIKKSATSGEAIGILIASIIGILFLERENLSKELLEHIKSNFDYDKLKKLFENVMNEEEKQNRC